ncbi:hypothetical protein ATO12_09410 [Aquimarina atlantica]|uniref:CHAT domain-containing protein n=1 Tax=Aquimarina atlantica TaxID=1317122 RepID=A0A023BY52_9FLAO|nr:CHAT domain-containing tetratricopeptide repeat protein [Aquimarina atlantica]EZH74940.1 hypothetical protein ATO12_09410 [Aquimarina atlantica]
MQKIQLTFSVLLFWITFFTILPYTTHAQVKKDTLLASQYFKKADSLFTEGNLKNAVEYFNKALPIYEKATVWGKVADCYNKISSIQKYKSDFKESLESANNALKICNQYLKSNNKHKANAYDNIGHYYEQSISDYKTAAEYFNKAFRIRNKIFPKNHESIALSFDKIGVLYHRQGLILKALENYKKCLDIRIKVFGENHVITSESYSRIALVYNNQGKYHEAISYYKKAIEINIQTYGENHIQLAKLYSRLADIYQYLSEYEETERLLKKALKIRTNKKAENRENLAFLYYDFGTLYKDTGKYDLSIRFYEKALALELELFGEENIYVANTYYSLGLLYGKMGFNNKKLEYQYKSLEIYLNKGRKNANIGKIYNSIGNALSEEGSYEKAMQFYKKSRDIAIQKFGEDHYQVATASFGIARMHFVRKEYQKALELFNKDLSVALNNYGEKHPKVATTYIHIGNINLAKKDYKNASKYYLKALSINQNRYGTDYYEITSILDKLGNLNREIDKYDKAIDYFKESLKIRKKAYSSPNKFIAQSYINIAQTFFESKEYQGAILNFEQAEKANIKNETNDTYILNSINNYLDLKKQLIISEGKAKTYVALYKQGHKNNNLNNAIVAYQKADTLINHIRKTHTNYKDKIVFSKKVKEVYHGAITAQLLVYKNQKDSKALEEAFYYAEKSKSNTLKESLTSSKAKNFAGLPEKIVALEKKLRNYNSFYQSKIIEEQSEKQIDSSKITHYESELFTINRRQDSLTNVLEKEYPKYYKLKYKNDIVTVSKVQQQLDNKTTVLEFFTADSVTYAFTVSKNNINVQELKTPTLEKDIVSFRKTITDKNLNIYQKEGCQLYKTLIEPIQDQLQGNRLIIIPDGPLWYLNFDLLLTDYSYSEEENTIIHPKEYALLLKDYAITYANSTNLLFDQQTSTVQDDLKQECLAFSFSNTTDTISKPLISFKILRSAGTDLPGTRKEIKAISDIIDGQYYYGSEATEANFKKNVNQYNILHLALHGEVNNERPENSKLFFTKNKDSLEDNLLYSHELFALNIPAELTVLSACNTGTGKIAKGEGIMSLGTAFQYAGTKSLLLTSWAVSDETTPALMQYFYANLKEGMLKDKALQQAKLQYINSKEFEYLAEPFYWGGFYLVGDTTAMQFNNNTQLYWVLGLGAVAVILLVVFLYRRRIKNVEL